MKDIVKILYNYWKAKHPKLSLIINLQTAIITICLFLIVNPYILNIKLDNIIFYIIYILFCATIISLIITTLRYVYFLFIRKKHELKQYIINKYTIKPNDSSSKDEEYPFDKKKYIYIYNSHDYLFFEAALFAVKKQEISASMLQRMFKIGLNRANKILDELYISCIIGSDCGAKSREVLIKNENDLEKLFLYIENLLKETYFPTSLTNDSSKTYNKNSIQNQGINSNNHLLFYDNMSGEEFEVFCYKLLIKNRYENVRLTKSTGDQGVDIVATKNLIKYAIQCKCYNQPIGNKAVQEVYSGKDFYNCHVAVVMTNQTFTPSAKELAQKNNVLLWDRGILNNLIYNANI